MSDWPDPCVACFERPAKRDGLYCEVCSPTSSARCVSPPTPRTPMPTEQPAPSRRALIVLVDPIVTPRHVYALVQAWLETRYGDGHRILSPGAWIVATSEAVPDVVAALTEGPLSQSPETQRRCVVFRAAQVDPLDYPDGLLGSSFWKWIRERTDLVTKPYTPPRRSDS